MSFEYNITDYQYYQWEMKNKVLERCPADFTDLHR